jgi:RNase adaptor protein for sRNA GlmZ degradation
MVQLHATSVAISTPLGPLAVLLRGASGAGKSDLALRLIDEGGWLIADDQVIVEPAGDQLQARAPEALAGALEVRGFGIAGLAHLDQAPLGLLVDLVGADELERLPAEEEEELCGRMLPRLRLDPFAVSATAKLRLAARARATLLLAPTTQELAERRPRRRDGTGSTVPVVIVSGLSGAGRTLALKTLEDIGYEAIDNLPLHLLGRAVRERDMVGPVAVGSDIRSRNFAVDPFLEQLDELVANPALDVRLLFLDCADDVLRRRFTATRRRHPLAQERQLSDGIAAERRLVSPLRARADIVVDTSRLSPPEFRRVLAGHLRLEGAPRMGIFVTSFSFRQGLPPEADLVFDVRFLRNPHYQPTLQPMSGQDSAVAEFIAGDPVFDGFFDSLTNMLAPLLPRYEAEGKSYLTIAVGCTGGRHRSVFIAERLSDWLTAGGWSPNLAHRDLGAAEAEASTSAVS